MSRTKLASTAGPARKEAEDYGIDMSLIESNLRMTPAQRIRQHSFALSTALALREAMQKTHDRP